MITKDLRHLFEMSGTEQQPDSFSSSADAAGHDGDGACVKKVLSEKPTEG